MRMFRVNGAVAKAERDAVLGVDKVWLPYDRWTGGDVTVSVEQ